MTRTFRNPVIGGATEDHGDPFVIKYLDSFYLYHSGETAGRRGISVHQSTNLVDWEFKGYALEARDTGWAWSDLWAPEVVYERGVFYMYVSATTKRPEGRERAKWEWSYSEGDETGRRLGVARATSPLGPFTPDPDPLLDQWSIDGHPFRDDDGSMWLFYNVLTEDLGLPDVPPGTGTVCDRLLAPDRLEGRPAPVTLPNADWEGVPTRDWYWNEGPYVLKRRGRYFQMYSGGAFADDTYAIGLASADSLRGPWTKDRDNPVVRGRGRIRGPGHHSFVFGPDVATPYAVYHGYLTGADGRKVHLDRLFWTGDRPLIVGPTDGEQPVPPPAVFDVKVPHWRAEAWVRGTWAEVGGERYELVPADVWHQVEVVQLDWRYALRVGGVLRASRPGFAAAAGEVFVSDGDVDHVTLMSALDDGGVHGVPEGSAHVWHWGGETPMEVSLAVNGTIDLGFDGDLHHVEGDRERFRLVRLSRDRGADEIAITAGPGGAIVADLAVFARPTA